MKYFTTITIILGILLSVSCGKDHTDTLDNYGPVYLKLSINGASVLDVTAEGPLEQEALVSARITTQDLGGSDETLRKNTLLVGASLVINQAESKVKSLSFSVPNVVGTGTYDLVDQGGLFVFSDSSNGMGDIKGYTITDSEDGTCTVNITEIGGEPIPAAGKIAKGTFTATIEDEGVTYTLKGSFNGGLAD